MHSRLSFLLLLFFITVVLQAKDPVMGYLKKDLSYFKYKDTQIALSIWLDEIAIQENIQLIVKYYDTQEEAKAEYEKGDVFSYSLNTFYYLQDLHTFDAITKEYWTMHQSGKNTEHLVLLVPTDSDIKELKDLKGKTIARKDDNLLATLFLDSELLPVTHHTAEHYIDHYYTTQKNSTALLKTFFHKCDACIVPESTLNMVSELNPIVSTRLHILKKSHSIYFTGIMLFHKDTSQFLMHKFRKSITDLDKTPKGKNIKELFKMKSFEPISKDEMQQLREYYLNYLKLKKKYDYE